MKLIHLVLTKSYETGIICSHFTEATDQRVVTEAVQRHMRKQDLRVSSENYMTNACSNDPNVAFI